MQLKPTAVVQAFPKSTLSKLVKKEKQREKTQKFCTQNVAVY